MAADLQVTPITWDIIGLDSNKPAVSGPDTFLVGARITNTGDAPISGVTADFTLGDSVRLNANDQWAKIANTYINAIGPTTTQSSYTIAAGQWVDVFFGVKIDRSKAAYTTARRYDITATNGTITDSLTDDPTDHTRQLYVERLVSQNRNATTSITVTKSGSNVVSASPGDILTIVHRTKSAPGGYEETVNELTLPNDVFKILSTTSAPLQTTFSVNAG